LSSLNEYMIHTRFGQPDESAPRENVKKLITPFQFDCNFLIFPIGGNEVRKMSYAFKI